VDLATGSASRIAFDPAEDDDGVAWSPDGKEIAYTREAGTLWRQPPGSANPVEIQTGFPVGSVRDWSPDGHYLVVTPAPPLKTFLVSASGDRQPQEVLELPLRRGQHRISPDGKWIAIAMGGAERTEVWLASFPAFGERRQISVAGGAFPVWRKDGRELFYLELDGGLMSVPMSPQPGTPRRLFQLNGVRRGSVYAVLADGKFLVLDVIRSSASGNTVTLNWTAGLKP
jgi:Tol biopolymer transport system component